MLTSAGSKRGINTTCRRKVGGRLVTSRAFSSHDRSGQVLRGIRWRRIERIAGTSARFDVVVNQSECDGQALSHRNLFDGRTRHEIA